MRAVTTRAVILARGLGTRMRRPDGAARLSDAQAAAADTGVKGLIPVGRPFLDYAISALADVGIRDVCLVVAPAHETLRERYGAAATSRVRVEFAVQAEPRGTADAVLAAERWTDGEPFLVVNSDNYYPVEAMRELAALEEPGLVAFSREGLLASGQMAASRVLAFAVLELAGDYLARIIEKPTPAELAALGSDVWVSMNCWRFDLQIFQACRDIPISNRGELELPIAVALGVRRSDFQIRALRSWLPVLDLSSRGDIASVTERLARVEARL
jgi:glucose-1-phosphate thymidylyltransferase